MQMDRYGYPEWGPSQDSRLGDGEWAMIGERLRDRLNAILTAGIDSEAQLVYFIVVLRKLMEHIDKNGAYYCGGHMGDDNPNTIPKIGYDFLTAPSAEVQAIGTGKPPSHITRAHNMPLDILSTIDHNPEKAAGAPAFFMAKTCDRVVMGGCQNSINHPFQWVVETFTWNGSTGTFNAGTPVTFVRIVEDYMMQQLLL